VEEEVLEKEWVLEESLEWFGEGDGETGFASGSGEVFELLKVSCDFLVLGTGIRLGLFAVGRGGVVRTEVAVYLFQSAFKMKDIGRIALKYIGLGVNKLG
jgi:hypothetical protein